MCVHVCERVCVVACTSLAFLLLSVNNQPPSRHIVSGAVTSHTHTQTHTHTHTQTHTHTHTHTHSGTASRKVISLRPDCSLQLFYTDQTPQITPTVCCRSERRRKGAREQGRKGPRRDGERIVFFLCRRRDPFVFIFNSVNT